MVLSSYEYDSYNPEYYFDNISSDTTYLKITDFAEEKPILDILKDNKDILQKTENLIVDVRVNHGGNDEFYFPLLDYIFDYKVKFKNLFGSDESMYTNYTVRNCDLWINELEDYLTQDLDEETRKSIHEETKSFQTNYGKGFLEVPEESEYLLENGFTPRHVYILTDYYYGISGDTFVPM
ncbi:S41 family peptidase [Salinicoccus sp. YB14-2]|uniref:S41 family peptidase n=1 Tax=Salinicoccus sp. YB14-2 TaxID=1572701 RepID=UPI000690F505|nr:S41 family peptidase [Salinicoccus sp. YB14-2]